MKEDKESLEEVPALFLSPTEVPLDLSEHPDLAALINLEEEGTPEETAENWKERGNNFFSKGELKYVDAIACYTKAIQQKGSNMHANSIYYSNRAAVNLQLGNYGRVIEDCKQAVHLNADNIKAYWRAAKAYVALHKIPDAIAFCNRDPENKALLEEKQKAQKKLQTKAETERKQLDEQKTVVDSRLKQYQQLEPEFKKRGITMGKQIYNTQNQYQGEVYLDDNGELHWPVMFLYEEHNQSDFIKDFNENHTFYDHLSYMFPANSLPEWDVEKKYYLENLEIYFEAGCTTPIQTSSKVYKKRWIKVRQTTALGKVISHPDCVVPGFPVFYIVAANSKFREELLKREFD